MNKEQIIAQLKAAAWALVALVGANEARKAIEAVLREIGDAQWPGPGGR